MKKQFLSAFFITFACALSLGQLLVDPQWLLQHLKDRDLVILQVGDAASHQKDHIVGARNFFVGDLNKPDNADHNMALPQQVAIAHTNFSESELKKILEKATPIL